MELQKRHADRLIGRSKPSALHPARRSALDNADIGG
jgi:hypothetical protein